IRGSSFEMSSKYSFTRNNRCCIILSQQKGWFRQFQQAAPGGPGSEGFISFMPSREILQLGNPALWKKSLRVVDTASTETRSLISDLSDTLAAFRKSTGYGRGIAAPQIGALSRIIFIRMQPTGFCGPLINPEIVWASDDRMELWDDCFSFPDLMVRVS